MKTPSTLRRFAIRSVLALLLSISIVASVTFAVAWPAAPAGEAPFGKIGTMFKSFFTGTDWAGGRVTIGDSAAVDPVSSRVQIKGLGTTSATAGLNVTNSSGVSTFKVNDDGSITASGAITAPSFVGGVTDSRVNGLSTSYIPKWNGTSLADSALYESANTKLIVKGSDTTSSNFGLNVTDSAGASKFLVRNDGNVGIGTTTPSNKFVVQVSPMTHGVSFGQVSDSTTYGQLSFNDTYTAGGVLGINGGGGTDNNMYLNVPTTGVFSFKVNDSEKVRFDMNGNVGIGTTNPGQKLEVVGYIGASGTGNVGLIVTTTGADGNNASLALNGGAANASWTLLTNRSDLNGAADSLGFYKGAGTTGVKMVINNAGNVGIGTTSPTTLLQVGSAGAGTSQYISIDAATNQEAGIQLKSAAAIKWYLYRPASSNDFRIYDTVDRVTFQAGGNVGIGTTTPGVKLDVNGAIMSTVGAGSNIYLRKTGGASIDFANDSGVQNAMIEANNAGNGLEFWTNTVGSTGLVQRMYINNAGNVGIGTTTPSRLLHVSGANNLTNSLYSSTNAFIGTNDASAADVGGTLGLGGVSGAGATYAFGALRGAKESTDSTDNGYLAMYTTQHAVGSLERMRISSTGDVGIGTVSPQAKLNVVPGNGVEGVRVSGSSNTLGLSLAYTDSATTHAYISNLYSGNAASDIQFQFGSTLGSGTVMTMLQSGNVGIGTASPAADFELARLTNAELRVSATDGLNDRAAKLSLRGSGNGGALLGGAIIDFTDTDGTPATPGSLTFQKSGSSYLTILDGGNVGIGTTGPIAKLQVSSAGTNNSITTNILSEITGTFTAGQRVGLGSSLDFRNDTGVNYAKIGAYCDTDCTNNQGALGFWTESVATTFTTSNPRMVINSSGNVGIGDTSPSSKLSVGGGPVVVDNDWSFGWGDGDRSAQIIGNSNSDFINFQTVGLDRVRIDSSGNVGIGTTAPGGYRTAIRGSGDTSATGSLWVSGATAVTPGLMVRDDGNVGIGTVTPAYTLDVNGAINATSVLVNGVAIGGGSQWTTNGSNIYYNTGNVGIGTTSPSFDANAASNATYLTLQSASTLSEIGVSLNQTSTTGYLGGYAFVNAGLAATEKRNAVILGANDGATNSGNMQFWTSSAGTLSERMRIDSSGNVGIGTTAADFKLTVDAVSGGGLKVQSSNANALLRVTNIAVGGDFLDIEPDTTGANIQMNDANVLRLDTSGNVGIGTTGPAAKLHIVAGTTITDDVLQLQHESGTADGTHNVISYLDQGGASTWQIKAMNVVDASSTGDLAIMTRTMGSTPALIVRDSGNVGIGTTGPGEHLAIEGTGSQGLSIYSTDTGSQGVAKTFIKLYGTNTSTAQKLQAQIASAPGATASNAGQLIFSTNNSSSAITERVRIDESGNVGIGTTAPGMPLEIVENSGRFAEQFIAYGALAHGITDYGFKTNSFGGFMSDGVATGGLTEWGYSDGTTNGLRLIAALGSADPVDTIAAIKFDAYKKSGTAVAALGNLETVLQATNGGSALLTILGSGNVGIGTAAPGQKLSINQSDSSLESAVQLAAAGIGNHSWRMSTFGSGNASMVGKFGFADETAGAWRMMIDTSGNIGIGTTNPQAKLSLVGGSTLRFGNDGDSGENMIYLRGGASGDKSTIRLNHYGFADWEIASGWAGDGKFSITNTQGGTDGIVIDTAGNVGIGTAGPGGKLDVQNTNIAVDRAMNVVQNHAAAGSKYGMVLDTLGASTSNYGLYVTVSGATNNYGIYSSAANNYFSGNVGIGTSSPGGYRTAIRGSGDTSATGALWVSGATAVTPGLMVRDDGNVGIGTANPRAALNVGHDNSVTNEGSTAAMRVANYYTNGGLYMGNGAYPGHMAISYNTTGRQGNNDFAPLDNTGYGAWVMNFDNIGSYNPTGFNLEWAPATAGTPVLTSLFHVSTNGNVGIGTTSPGQKLEVYSSGYTGATNFATKNIKVNSGFAGGYTYGTIVSLLTGYDGTVYATDIGHEYDNTGYGLTFSTNSTTSGNPSERMRIDHSGNVGIGTTTPGYKLDVQGGGVNASGGYTQTSDIRLKTNIEYLNSKDSLRKIISLRGIHFNWKDEKKLGSDRQIGIIAQDVQKVFPEAVKTDTEGYLSVSYSNLVVPLIEAVKELSSKVGHLENRIEELFAKYLDQQDEINTLKLQNQSFEKRLERLEKAQR